MRRVMKPQARSASRFVLMSATCMILALFAHSRAHAAPACAAVKQATFRSYQALWLYKSLAPSSERFQASLQQTAEAFSNIGVDFRAKLTACGDDTKLPYEMLAAYWYEQEAKDEGASGSLVSAMTQRLRDLHDEMPANNMFFGQFLRDVTAAYKQLGMQLPGDVATWAADRDIPADAECRMPYYQDATIKSFPAPAYPISALSAGFGPATSDVRVTIGGNGHASYAGILHSSGNAEIDQASVDAALGTTFYPKTIYCNPLSGTYSLHIIFDPHSPATATMFRAR
jgi:hypothetical protein